MEVAQAIESKEATVEAAMPVVVETVAVEMVAATETEPIDKHELTTEVDGTHQYHRLHLKSILNEPDKS